MLLQAYMLAATTLKLCSSCASLGLILTMQLAIVSSYSTSFKALLSSVFSYDAS